LHAHREHGVPLISTGSVVFESTPSAVERRIAALPARRAVKKDWQVAWLLRHHLHGPDHSVRR